MLVFVLRLFKELKTQFILKILYCSLVRPILEYEAIIWDPYAFSDTDQLEKVQWRFLGFAKFILKIPSEKTRLFMVDN